MTVTLQIPAEYDSQIAGQAAARGVKITEYLLELIKRNTPAPAVKPVNADWEKSLAVLTRGCEHMPILAPGAADRENIYRDHD